MDTRIAATIEVGPTQPRGRLLHLCGLLFLYLAAYGRSFSGSELRFLDNALEIVQLALEMADPLLVFFLLSAFRLTGLEGFGQAADVALCKLGSMTYWDVIYPKHLLDLGCEIPEGLGRWIDSNGFDKLIVF